MKLETTPDKKKALKAATEQSKVALRAAAGR
jgi:hypothetical protein